MTSAMSSSDSNLAAKIASPPASSGISMSMTTTMEERLSAILNSSQFTVASYLNLALDEAAAGATTTGAGAAAPAPPPTSGGPPHEEDLLQQRMAELALQLQLQTQACHEDIGRIGAELQAILPRCAADVGRVGVGLEGLRMDASSLLQSTSVEASEQEEVSSSLETLSTLHALQANLQRTKDILTAAATWDTTLSSVAPLLEQQNLSEAVHALAQLESGERALRGMPHVEERQESIAKIRDQVSKMLQPQLKHALENMNTRLAPLQQCVTLYSKLGNMNALKEEYVKNRPASIHKAWFHYTPSYPHKQDDNKDGVGAAGLEGAQPNLAASSFLTWLPSWFDAVLSLVTEERRQSMAIFGPDLVAEIVIKVFRECFRPILPSFQSRLESIYSSNSEGSSTISSTKGSLESICAIYESTLQFLSLSYESIAGGWLDMVEGGMIQQTNGVDLFHDMNAIFLQVASPFKAYQKQLALLEAKHSTTAMKTATTDIHAAVQQVASKGSSLETLQVATEQLQGMSSSVFLLAEGAVARFELMNGGYGAADALSTIDKLMAQHAAELAGAIRKLSAATDEQHSADNFDEPQVLCALKVLKIAGTFRREMESVELKTRERMGVLAERMEIQAAHEKQLEEASSKSRGASAAGGRTGASSVAASSSSTLFVLPDSLSPVEIDSFLTKAVCCDANDEEFNSSYALLQRLASTTTSSTGATVGSERGTGPISLYPETDEAAKGLAHSCHCYIFDVCSAVPLSHLTSMASMAAWSEEAGAINLASYGTLPQQYITQVGEHMLALVQALEPFASDPDALSLANEVMDGVRNVAKQPWQDFVEASGSVADADNVVKIFMDGKGIVDYVLGDPVLEEEDLEDEDEDEAQKATTAFCNAWLDVVGLAVAGRLLERIMRIPSLTPKGCEHLNADLNYLVNVFSALGVAGHPHPLLGHLAELSLIDGSILAERIAARNRSDPVESSLLSVEERLAAMRGVSATYKY